MAILATGAGGTVGSYLPDGVVKTDVGEVDVTDRTCIARALDQHRPDAVLHLAAATDVDLCERDPRHAYLHNALGTRNVALECAQRGVPLAYVSTAGVFFGDKPEPYNEFDVPRPANVYGASKLAGENYVRQLAPNSFIVRAGWMIGGGPDGEKKFVAKMLERAEKTGSILAVDDKWGSPTYASQLVDSILELLQGDSYGLYHMCNQGMCSRYDIALAVNEELGSPFEVRRASSAEFPLPAPRARSEAMENLVLELEGRNQMPDWREAIAEYVGKEWSGWSPSVPTADPPPVPASA